MIIPAPTSLDAMSPNELLAQLLAVGATWTFVQPDSRSLAQTFASRAHWDMAVGHVAAVSRTPAERVQAELSAYSGVAGTQGPPCRLSYRLTVALLSQLSAPEGCCEGRASPGRGQGASALGLQACVKVIGRDYLSAILPEMSGGALRGIYAPLTIGDGWDAHVHDAPAATCDPDDIWADLMKLERNVRRDSTSGPEGRDRVGLVKVAELEGVGRGLRKRIDPSGKVSEVSLLRDQVVAHLSRCDGGIAINQCEQCRVAVSYLRTKTRWLALFRTADRMSGLLEFTSKFDTSRDMTRDVKSGPVLWDGDFRAAKRPLLGKPGKRRWFLADHRKPLQISRIGDEQLMREERRRSVAAAARVAAEVQGKSATGSMQGNEIAGVDIVSREIGWHPELWAPFYEAAGKAGLILAMHVGEDMADLLTGLRLLSEGLTMLLRAAPQGEPRLGHATAIRVDPTAWYSKQGRSRPALWEHALDVLWAHEFLAGDWESAAELDLRWQAVKGRLGGCLASTGLAEAATQYRQGLPACACVAQSDDFPNKLVRPRCTGEVVATEWDGRHEFVPSSAWLRLVARCQDAVRRQVAQHAIVEVCPTSNAAISGLGWSFALDMGMPEPSKPALKVRIGTDDPGLLATSLPLERAMLREWYLRCGRTPEKIDAWLAAAFSRLPP
jgi:hypothetical protein